MKKEVFVSGSAGRNSEELQIKRGPQNRPKVKKSFKVLSLEPTLPPFFLLGQLISLLNFQPSSSYLSLTSAQS